MSASGVPSSPNHAVAALRYSHVLRSSAVAAMALAAVAVEFALSPPLGEWAATAAACAAVMLAGISWGKRGLWVAGILAATVVVRRFLASEGANPVLEALRVSILLAVATVVGELRDRTIAARRALRESEEQHRSALELARRQEEQLVHSTRLAELGEMAAAVAHELNQPLTGIRNFAKNAHFMIERQAGTPEQIKENLLLISGQVDRASRIIGQMRELTRRADHEFAPVNLHSTLRESLEFLMPQMRLSNVEVALDLAPALPEVMGDRIRLEQVFLNLLTNARQAMENAPVRRLTVRTAYEPDAELPVAIEIADTGVGFAPEQAEKLFTPFFSTKMPGHGTGLGLSISLTIVQAHGGAIEAIGAPAHGARFTVRLPVATRAPSQELPCNP